MSHQIESLVAICKAANPEFKSESLEQFEDNHDCEEISGTYKVCGILGLTRKGERGWETMPHLYELLVEQAALNSEDRALMECNSIDNDPYLLKTIFVATGWEEEYEADIFDFVCNVLKVLGLVVGSATDQSWKPTARLKNLVISRLVGSLKADVRVTKADLLEADDQNRYPDETWNEDEGYENPDGEDNNRPKSIFKRRNQMVVGKHPKGTGPISRLSVVKREHSSA